MKSLFRILSYIGLGLTLIPSFLVFAGEITLDSNKLIMLMGTVLWFITSPSWMNKNEN